MNDDLARQLIRQLKLLNFWITLFGVTMLVGFAVIGFLLWQVISFAQSTAQRVEETRQQFDVQQQVCEGDSQFSRFLRSAGACE